MIRKSIVCLGITIPAVLAVLGCGDSTGLPPRYRVSGTVTYNGKPLEKGTINFTPAKPEGRAAGGTIVDGSYSLTTLDPDDGALPGSYKVSIIAKETDTSKVDLKLKRGGGALNEQEKNAMKAAYPQKIAAKAAAAAKSLIPARYSLPETSELTCEVKEQSNTANFSLTD